MILQTAPGPELNPIPALLGYLAVMLIGTFLLYIYFAITLMMIARKTNTPNGWLAWLPIGNLFLMCNIGRRSGAWVLLLLIPLVNIFALAMIWISIAEVRGKSPWVGAMILIPVIGLFVPAYLAAGQVTQPGMAAGPRHCPTCGFPAQPAATYCGNCRNSLPVAPPVAASAPTGKMIPVAIAAVLVIAPLTGAVVWYFFFRELQYNPPVRQQPELPQRAQGTITEFPVDTDPDAPARPSSVIAQEFDDTPARRTTTKVQVPQEWLPPGVGRDTLPRRTTGMTSATYSAPKRPRATAPAKAPTPPPETTEATPANEVRIYVHVLNVPSNRAGEEITGEIVRAARGNATGVRVNSPNGGVYTGSRIQTSQTTIYVLNKQRDDIVIIIYSPDPEGQAVAERLAGNIGNGKGLNDYPEVRETLWTLPPDPPGDLTLAEVNTLTRQEMERSLLEAGSGTRGEGTEEVQKMLAQIRRFIPERLTAARYVDGSRRDWGVIQCDFASTRRAANNWFILRWTLGLSGMESVQVSGVEGLYANQDKERLLMFQKGPYLIFLVGPSAAPLEQLAGLANNFQV